MPVSRTIGLTLALLYASVGVGVIISDYGCVGIVCDLRSYLVAAPWSKLWDVGGPLSFSVVGQVGIATLHTVGVLANSVAIFYFVRLAGLAVRKMRSAPK